jgi:hypothetical protein
VYTNNEILFPPAVIPTLKQARGEVWRELTERVSRLPDDHPESLAYSLLMIRLDGCMGCETDSYRAMRGCQACAQQVLRRHKGSDGDLLERYQRALNDVRAYLEDLPEHLKLAEVEPARAA